MNKKINQPASPNKSVIVIPSNVRYSKKLSANAKLIFGEINLLASKTGKCWATNDYFSKNFAISKRTITRVITDLVNEGFIQVDYFFEIIDKKKVSKRIIEINKIGIDKNVHIDKNVYGGMDNGVYGGIDTSVQHNITRKDNITSIISCDDDKNDKKEKSKENKTSSSAIVFDEDLFKPTNAPLDLKEAENLFYKWQKFAGENNLVPLIKLTSIRLKNIKARLNESEFNFDEILSAIKTNEFWKIKYAGGQGVGFDDIIKSDYLYLKILEGRVRKNNFSNNGSNGNSTKRIKCEFCSQSLVDGKHCYSRGCKNEMPIFLNDV